MRALKQFLKLKKGYCERQACRCLTVGMRRDYQNLPEVCDCGDWGSTPPVPPVPSTYTVTITTNDATYGTVDVNTVEVEWWTSISALDNVLTVWTTDITATAEAGYTFDWWTVDWWALPSTVDADITVVANFTV